MPIHEPNQDETCPVCGQGTPSLKRYEFPFFYFAIIAAGGRMEKVEACPECLRAWMRRWGLISLLAANIFWPAGIAPVWLIRWLASFRFGHVPWQRPLWKRCFGTIALTGVVIGCVVGSLIMMSEVFGEADPTHQRLMFFSVVMAFVALCGVVAVVTDA